MTTFYITNFFLTFFQRQSCRGVQSRFHIFFQNLQESICVRVSVQASLFDKVAQVTFGFFYNLFQAATLQKNSSKGSCKFSKIFWISYKTPEGKYFCFFQIFEKFYHCSQNSISPVLSRQLPLRSPMKTAYWKSGTRNPGPLGGTLWLDPKFGPWDLTLRQDPKARPYSGTLKWDLRVGP